MRKTIKTALLMLTVMTFLTGLVYPLAVTGIAQLAFHYRANGSLVRSDSGIIGSALIGQNFYRSEYFHGRPSAAGKGYDALSSGPSNLGPTNHQLIDIVRDRVEAVRKVNGLAPGEQIPADLVTASGSGLDPNISPNSAYLQVKRVAESRGLPEQVVRKLVDESIEDRQLWILGKPRVNVLLLNLKLDQVEARY